jgi:tryptophan-rich sensory protein
MMIFALVSLALGMLMVPVALCFGELSAAAPGLVLSGWLFGAVWTVIYPALGVAAYRLRALRARRALWALSLTYGYLLAFLPVATALHDQRATALMDLVSLPVAFYAAREVSRVDRVSWRYMLPLLAWLPVTTALKLATLDALSSTHHHVS